MTNSVRAGLSALVLLGAFVGALLIISVTEASAAETYGARLVLADVARDDGTARHDPARLAAAYAEVFAS